jgi:ribosomal protein L32
MIVHWVVRETRRINEELERARRAARVADRQNMPKLRRDPHTGEYRL